jgi:hypothetical protein
MYDWTDGPGAKAHKPNTIADGPANTGKAVLESELKCIVDHGTEISLMTTPPASRSIIA